MSNLLVALLFCVGLLTVGWAVENSSVSALLCDPAGKCEEQEPHHDEIDNLNPTAGAERMLAHRCAKPVEVRAKKVFEHEHRHEKRGADHACPRCKVVSPPTSN